MTWRPEAPQGKETAKTRWRAAAYTRGKGLDLGCNAEKLWDTKNCIGIDSCRDSELFGHVINPDIKADVTNLSMFASRSFDFVFSSHTLEHIEFAKAPQALRDWCRLVKKGGYLVLYLPLSGLYPDPGEQYANSDHQFAVTYDVVDEMMKTVPRDWDHVSYEICKEDDEYSGFWAYKMTSA